VRHLFLVDPRTLAQAQVDWILAQLKFQYNYRQAIWLFTHWIHLPKLADVDAESDFAWQIFYARREELKNRLRSETKKLGERLPLELHSVLLQTEPAF
jgi:hypothetical protein